MQELHFAVPMSGAVLCTLNIRHNSTMISHLLRHSEAKVLFVDYHLLPIAQEAISLLANADGKPPILVIIPESDGQSSSSDDDGGSGGDHQYEALLGTGQRDFCIRWPKSELDPISINYTSGTTSQPKGVVYCHRGAYLNAIATFCIHEMNSTMVAPVYLWTVPMFHCNGWCLVWGLAALGGTNICLRKVSPDEIFQSICLHKVTHMGGAPTVLNMIVNSSSPPLPRKVSLMTGGSPPPPEIIYKIEKLGFRVSHLYGLTEVYGPGTHCLWKPEWDSLPPAEQSKLKARQGVQHIGLEEVDVRDCVTMESVPADGKTVGEIMFRGNTVMSGYLKDIKATEEAFEGGWFRSGDLAVKHPDNFIELKDRKKDIIISGGENISSVEVESVLYEHPAVVEAAVVGRPDNHWGQTPCAFVKLKEGFEFEVDAEEELIGFCRNQMSHYMVPKTIIFDDLPKTSTGKIQKFILKEKAKALGSLS